MTNKALDSKVSNQYSEEVDIPSDPGPAVAGRTPLVGSVRRSQGLPVIRDELKDEF